MFQDISVVELIQNPSKKQKLPLIDRFNCVSRWVSTEIVLEPNIRKRTHVLKRFIRLADVCFYISLFFLF